jgi:hypothetical protein
MVGDIVTKCVTGANRQVVIIVDEFPQFIALMNYIGVPFEFCHGGASNRESKDGTKLKDILPEKYWKSDIAGAVERFNKGETKVIIGTSAISTGVDLVPVGCLIYLQGGKSEVGIKQAIGRGTRKFAGLSDFWVIDFNIVGSTPLERHCNERIKLYKGMGEVETFDIQT